MAACSKSCSTPSHQKSTKAASAGTWVRTFFRVSCRAGNCCSWANRLIASMVACNRWCTCARSGRRVVDVKRMQGEREGFQVMPIRAVDLFPSLHLGATGLDCSLGLGAVRRHWRTSEMARQGLLGSRKPLVGLVSAPAQWPANSS